MSLTDIMSGADLWAFPSIALVLFLIVFGAAVWRAWSPAGETSRKRMASLPLEDDQPLSPAPPAPHKPEAAR